MTAKGALSLSSPRANDSNHGKVTRGDSPSSTPSSAKMQKLISQFSKEKSFSFLSIRDDDESPCGIADGSSSTSSSSLNGSSRNSIGGLPLHPKSKSLTSPTTEVVASIRRYSNKNKDRLAAGGSGVSNPASRRIKNPINLKENRRNTEAEIDDNGGKGVLRIPRIVEQNEKKPPLPTSQNNNGGDGDDGDDDDDDDEVSIEDLETFLEENRRKESIRRECGVDDTLHSSRAGSSVQFSDVVDLLELDQEESEFEGEELFYTEEEIDRFRYEAFMESCGLDPEDHDYFE